MLILLEIPLHVLLNQTHGQFVQFPWLQVDVKVPSVLCMSVDGVGV